MKATISTPEAPAAIGPYAQGVRAAGLIFTSGQIPLTPAGELVSGTIEDETTQVLTNLQAILGTNGFDRVVSTRIYLTDLTLFEPVNTVYARYFKPENLSARETVGVAALPKGARIEISMVATAS